MIGTITALRNGLVTWGLDRLREQFLSVKLHFQQRFEDHISLDAPGGPGRDGLINP